MSWEKLIPDYISIATITLFGNSKFVVFEKEKNHYILPTPYTAPAVRLSPGDSIHIQRKRDSGFNTYAKRGRAAGWSVRNQYTSSNRFYSVDVWWKELRFVIHGSVYARSRQLKLLCSSDFDKYYSFCSCL